MRSPHVVLAATLLAAPLAIAGCSGEAPTEPSTGTLRVSTTPGGDPDGYRSRSAAGWQPRAPRIAGGKTSWASWEMGPGRIVPARFGCSSRN